MEVCQPVAASYDPSTTNDVAKGNRQQGFYEEIEPGQALCCNAVDLRCQKTAYPELHICDTVLEAA